MRRLELLQWFGLLAGAAMWAAAHVVGFGTSQAACGAGGSAWQIELHSWEGLINGLAGVVSVAAALAAGAVLVLTRDVSYEDSPPEGRMRFFAIAALLANVLFITMVVLYAAGSIANSPCRQG
jgi:hypothetical protein